MFNSEAMRALVLVVAHPAFQGVVAALSLVIAIMSALLALR